MPGPGELRSQPPAWIIGRDAGLARLRGLVDPVPQASQVLLVTGEAGMGKTALLADTAGRARSAGIRVLSVTGRESESNLAFAGLHQLLRPVLPSVAGLPGRQAQALLGALGQALAGWTGGAQVLVDLEGHGREDVFEGVDLSRTVGWFTSLTPVLLAARRSAGYGVPEVSFNYLGRAADGLRESLVFRSPAGAEAAAAARAERHPGNRRTHLLEVQAEVSDGRLRTAFGYSERRHLPATIEALAAAYRRVLEDRIAAPDRRLAGVLSELGG